MAKHRAEPGVAEPPSALRPPPVAAATNAGPGLSAQVSQLLKEQQGAELGLTAPAAAKMELQLRQAEGQLV